MTDVRAEEAAAAMPRRAVDERVSPARRSVLLDAANALADARRTKTPIPALPEEQRPVTALEAYAIQEELAVAFGAIGGWKVGAASPDAEPTCAPMPKSWTAGSGVEFRALRYRGIEAEVAFLVGEDLPLRAEAYRESEVLAAMTSCHPAIEILETAFEDPSKVDRLSTLGDLALHGGFCFGPAYADWQNVAFAEEGVTVVMDGVVRVERTGSNPAGDFRRLLVWLANEGSRWAGGLKAGQWITTGSWTGSLAAEARSAVMVSFNHLGSASVQFAPEQDLEKGLPGVTRKFD